jgi:hypothetical protein
LILLGILAVGLGVVIVVGFLAAGSDNARTTRLKTQGIHVQVTVVDCIGNLGGSGSNGAGYTCQGTYRADQRTYREVIGSMASFAKPGTVVAGVVDPSHPSTVVVASAVASSSTSATPYVVLIVLMVVELGVLGLIVLLGPRRRLQARDAAISSHA